ncbi:MAG: hypothetical protein JEY94_00965 [Melioribacteraceae bacterium]|nr:hypothetical protein [Melioribacteraceae bacterium]
MGYPIKTSQDDWLNKAIELFYNRVSFDLIDDGNFDLNLDSEILKVFAKTTLKESQIIWRSIFYVFALVCAYLFVISFSVIYGREIAQILSALGVVACIAIPSLMLKRNKSPKIIEEDGLIKITFK